LHSAFEALLEHPDALRALLELTAAVAGERDPVTLARAVAERATAVLGAEGVAVYAWDDANQVLEPLYLREPHAVSADSRLRPGAGLAGMAVERGASVVIESYAAWEHAQPAVVAKGVCAAAAVPLLVGGRVVGALGARFTQTYPDLSRRVEILTLLAGQVAPALDSARARADSEEQAEKLHVRARLLDAVGQAVIATDRDGLITYWNRHAEQLYGWTAEEVLGRPVVEVTPSETTREQAAQIMQRLGAGESWSGEFLVRRRNGTSFPAHVTNSPIRDAQGEVVGVVGVSFDVTARQQGMQALAASERRFRALVENVFDVITLLRPDGTIEYQSPSGERVLGYAAEQLIGRVAFDYVHPDDVPSVKEDFFRVLHGGPKQRVAEYRFMHRDGTWRWMQSIGRDLRDEIGVGAILISSRDVTGRKLAEVQREGVARSEKLRALGQMASGVAHDLNQSLGLVAGYSDLAAAELRSPEPDRAALAEALEVVAQAAADGGQTVKRLLLFGRGQGIEEHGPVDMGRLLKDVARLTAPRWRDQSQIEGRPISLDVSAPPHEVLCVSGSAAHLREALTNLIFNSVDAMPSGGAIQLNAWPNGDRIAVEVTDTGVGMPIDIQQRIFEPYFTTKGERGTGLGLSMVFGVVEQHGGTIELQSSPGQGTTVRIVLPRSDSVAPPVPIAEPTLASSRRRVLAVDDEVAMVNMVRRVLQLAGHEVQTATSADQALEILERAAVGAEVDIVISDLSMGVGMTGWDLAEQVRQRWPGVRFILATGWGAGISVDEARGRGVDAVIAKPYRAEDLQRVASVT
jgi:PAS domain S-box-containing protein